VSIQKGQKRVRLNEDGTVKKVSALFRTAEELTETDKTENILAACPDTINTKDIKLSGRSYRNLKLKVKHTKGKFFSEDDRIKAATVYAMVGNASRVEEITGIPSATVRKWKTMEWWPQVIDRIRNEADDELDVKLTGLINKATAEVNDRLDKGDYVYNVKTGEVIRKPMSGIDAARITATFVDKRTLIRKKSAVKSEQATSNDRLAKLAQEFAKFVQAKEIKGEKIEQEVSSKDAAQTQEVLTEGAA